MSSSSTTPPPDGYASWLDYAVETLDTRQVQLGTMFDNDKPWIPREDMRAAAHQEILALKQATGTPGSILLKRWKLPLSQRTGRSEDAIVEDALLATDFPASSVHIVFEDGSELSFRRAFYLGEVEKRKVDRTICRVAVFTEHCGYHEFWIGPDDRIDSMPIHTDFENKTRVFTPERPHALAEFDRLNVSELKGMTGPAMKSWMDRNHLNAKLAGIVEVCAEKYTDEHHPVDPGERSLAINVQTALRDLGRDVSVAHAAAVWEYHSATLCAGWMLGAETVDGAIVALVSLAHFAS